MLPKSVGHCGGRRARGRERRGRERRGSPDWDIKGTAGQLEKREKLRVSLSGFGNFFSSETVAAIFLLTCWKEESLSVLFQRLLLAS